MMGQVYCTSGTIPYGPSIFDTQGAHAPLCPHKTQRDKVLAAMQPVRDDRNEFSL